MPLWQWNERMGNRLFKLVTITLLAGLLGYVVALGIGLVAFEVFDVSKREGATRWAWHASSAHSLRLFVVCFGTLVLGHGKSASWKPARLAKLGVY